MGTIERVGFIGVGTMGLPMASNLLARGFRLVVHDLNERPVQELVAKGAERAGSGREVGECCSHVVLMLPASRHVEAALTGPEGVIAGLAPGGTIIDMSTIDPGTTQRMAQLAASKGQRLIDAPVSGAPLKAKDGTLTIMVGGDAEVVEECRPILAAMGSNIIHVGSVGAGETVKLVNNLIAAISMAAVAEAFSIGVRAGLSPQIMYEVVSKSSGDCWCLRTRVPYPGVIDASPANEDFAPGFMLDLMHKDVGLALELARSVGAPTRLGGLIQTLLTEGQQLGLGRLDFSAVAKVIEASGAGDPGEPPRPPKAGG